MLSIDSILAVRLGLKAFSFLPHDCHLLLHIVGICAILRYTSYTAMCCPNRLYVDRRPLQPVRTGPQRNPYRQKLCD
jgi:hypothetical protein